MKTPEIIKVGQYLEPLLAPDCYHFMWTTASHLPDALEVMKAWGFKYKNIAFVWVKTTKHGKLFWGPGSYIPNNAELCLFGVKGRPWHSSFGEKPFQIVMVPHPRDENNKIIHSRKPYEVENMIADWLLPQAGDGQMMELFATERKPRWHCVGHELSGNDIKEDLLAFSAMEFFSM